MPLTWTSSRPGDLSVDANGQVRALLDSGYSENTASLPGSSLKGSLIFNVISNAGGGGGGGNSTPSAPTIRGFGASSTSVIGASIPILLSADAESDVTYNWRMQIACDMLQTGDTISTVADAIG